jgi:hypothetical protein
LIFDHHYTRTSASCHKAFDSFWLPDRRRPCCHAECSRFLAIFTRFRFPAPAPDRASCLSNFFD